MESCPPEICQTIFSFICTDGGYTGRTLSLVSKYIHSASLPIKLQTVSIKGTHQMKGFAAYLESLDPNHRRVRHLFITDLPSTRPTRQSLSFENSQWRLVVPSNKDKEDARSQAIRRIIELTAQSIVSLSICIAQCEHTPVLLPYHLPRLTELTTLLCISSPQIAVLSLESLKCHRRLRRWNIKGLRVESSYLSGIIARVAPALTHLRLSGVTRHDWSLEAALSLQWSPEDLVALAQIGTPLSEMDFTVKLPSTIREVYLEPVHDFWSRMRNVEPTYQALTRMVSQVHVHRVHVENLCARANDWQEVAGVAEKEWRERFLGQRGCWIHPRNTYSKNIAGSRKSLDSSI